MKKRLFLLCILLALVFGLSAAASAAQTDAQLPYIVDDANLLSADQQTQLEQRAEALADTYDCGVYIVTVEDFTEYTSSYSIESFAEEVFQRYTLGVGEQDNGIMLVLSMADRDFDLCAYGSGANYAFTDYGKDWLANRFLDDFRDNDWYQGFSDYMTGSTRLLQLAAEGKPFDYDTDPEYLRSQRNFKIGIVVIVPLLIAMIACLVMKGQMKSAIRKTDADEYIPPRSMRLTLRTDQYLRTTQSRVRIESDRSSSGGHGGTSVNSGGFSHHSGKF